MCKLKKLKTLKTIFISSIILFNSFNYSYASKAILVDNNNVVENISFLVIPNIQDTNGFAYLTEEFLPVSATYYFTTNEISYGAVVGRSASLTVPTTNQTSVYPGPVTNGQYFASYLIPSNQMPAILVKGLYEFTFKGRHTTQPNKNPTIMGDLYIKNTSDGITVQEFESTIPTIIPYNVEEFKIIINITNDVIRDSYAFLLKTRMVNNDGYNGDFESLFGPQSLAKFIIPSAPGVYLTHFEWDIDKTNRVNKSDVKYVGLPIFYHVWTNGDVYIYVISPNGQYTNKLMKVSN